MKFWQKPIWTRNILTSEVILPLVFLALILSFLTGVLYSNGRRESLASSAESILIEQSIKARTYYAEKKDKVAFISVRDFDFTSGIEQAPSKKYVDAHIKEYINVLEKVMDENPQSVYLTWNAGAHPEEANYWQPLANALKALDPTSKKIEIAYSDFVKKAPPDLGTARYLVASDCYYDINSYCGYLPSWDNWIMQVIFEKHWDRKSSWVISRNLPHIRESYLLNLPSRTSMRSFTFSDFLKQKHSKLGFKNSVVFIGNATSQPNISPNNKIALQKTYTALDLTDLNDLNKYGTPLHEMWAQAAQMLVDGKAVRIFPRWGSYIIIISILVSIAYSVLHSGLIFYLTVFVLVSISAPYFNSILLKYFLFYIPVFENIYWGFLGFAAVGFLRLSLNSYFRSLAESEGKHAEKHSSLKTNFIAMISHNLNTPMAQLQGLADLLKLENLAEKKIGSKIVRCIATLRRDIQSVLLSSSIDVGRTSAKIFSIYDLKSELKRGSGQILDRLNISYNIDPSQENTSEAHCEVIVDHKLLSHFLMLILAKEQTSENSFFSLEFPPSGKNLEISILRREKTGIDDAENLICKEVTVSKRSLFEDQVSQEYINLFLEIYNGRVERKDKASEKKIIKIFFSSKIEKN